MSEGTRIERVSVWPCDHGGVEVERVPRGATCAQCGSHPRHYIPVQELAAWAREQLRKANNGFDGAATGAPRASYSGQGTAYRQLLRYIGEEES